MDLARLRILCIGAPRAEDRRARMTALFAAQGLDGVIAPGCDALAMDRETLVSSHDAAAARRMGMRTLTASEQACSESHFRALGGFLDGPSPYLLVFEDNVEFGPELVDFLRRFDADALDFDLIKFEERKRRSQFLTVASCGPVALGVTPQIGSGAVALLYSRRGAERLFASRLGYTHCYDDHISLYWRHRAYPLVVRPPLARRAAVASTVDATDARLGVGRRPKLDGALSARIRRSAYRLWRMAGKYWGCLSAARLARSVA
jgi:GR25 family glycosyltransferase involved in LPS biosynthesis